eukprot:2664837-Pyramimonas_sp.AAC.1
MHTAHQAPSPRHANSCLRPCRGLRGAACGAARWTQGGRWLRLGGGGAPGWRGRGRRPCRGPRGGACGGAGTAAWVAARVPARKRAAMPLAPLPAAA